MSRLRHDVSAYLMTLRMTQYRTIIFVEGRDNDPTFYGAIATRYQRETGRSVDLRLAEELPAAARRGETRGGAGGKRVLYRAATFLVSWRNREAGRFLRGKEIAFCADKDVDDILGAYPDCPAMICTPLHSVENHLIRGCDLHRVICCAVSAPSSTVQREMGDCNEILALARRWKEWVIYCLVSLRLGIRRSGNYGQESPFNDPAHDQAEPIRVTQAFALAKRSHGDGLAFDAEVRAVTQFVDDLIQSDRYDEVFKGKWYASILFHCLESRNPLRTGARACGKNGLWVAIRSNFSLSDGDYNYYANKFARLG